MRKKEKIAILLCCHERKEHTKACLDTLFEAFPDTLEPTVVAVDAGSTDGTTEMLKDYPMPCGRLVLIRKGADLFWNGAMRVAMSYTAKYLNDSDYVFLINDDVRFLPGAPEALVRRMKEIRADAVAGATKASDGTQSYGGVRLTSRCLARYELIPPSEDAVLCDTFNCNCLLLTGACFLQMGNLDPAYVHSMGDYDYGLRLKKAGKIVVNSADYTGVCDDNKTEGSWRDRTLPRGERLKKKESPKGLPRRDWYHYVRKNYSFPAALYHSLTPYLRILLGL